MRTQKNYRLNADTLEMLEELRKHFDVTETMMVEMAIQQMAKKWFGAEKTEEICMRAWKREEES